MCFNFHSIKSVLDSAHFHCSVRVDIVTSSRSIVLLLALLCQVNQFLVTMCVFVHGCVCV
uniref:Uncharacterized protein n=1 Tax=Solanum lycopersicum TaxID=4081 RepID=A0A3Q7HEI3_SOLLC